MTRSEKPPIEFVLESWDALLPALPVLVNSVSKERVFRTARTRGIQFLTVALPTLGKALLSVLRGDHWKTPDGFASYKKKEFPYPLPVLFNEILYPIIDPCTGLLRSDRTNEYIAQHVRTFRQVTMFAYKLVVDPTEEQIQEGRSSFSARNAECGEFSLPDPIRFPWLNQARRIVHSILGSYDPLDIQPRHSSGAVAEGRHQDVIHRWKTFRQAEWSPQLDNVFPFSEYGFVNQNHLVDSWLYEPSCGNTAARLTHVPKDSRGPRWICCEPVTNQFIQQGLMSLMYEAISRFSTNMPLRDQAVMRDLAWAGSVTGALATLDLEAASDRLPWKLVEYLFPDRWVIALRSARSTHVAMSKGETELLLHTAFPMGASVCFPVETIVFWSICAATCGPAGVYAYGDDLIVPTAYAEEVIHNLTLCNARVNNTKSFSVGHFRESCGSEWFDGVDVSYVQLRRTPRQTTKGSWLTADSASFLQFLTLCGRKGLIHSMVRMRNIIDVVKDLPDSLCRVIRYASSDASFASPFLPSWWNARYCRIGRDIRYSIALQRYEVRTLNYSTVEEQVIDGWDGVFRYLLSPISRAVRLASADPQKALLGSGSVGTRLRWSWSLSHY